MTPPADLPDGPQIVDILAVDDTPSNLAALEAALATPGVRVARAASGTEALALVPRNQFAVVILDARMPVLDGFAMARRIHEAGGAAPLVFLTAFDLQPQDVRRAYASGAVDFVVKPFDPEVLRSKVAVFVDLFRQRRQAERLKDEVVATLAHELRTPLSSLLAAADSLERIPVQDQTLARVHALIRRQLAHLSRLVEDALEVARLTQGKVVLRPRIIDLRDVIQRAVELCQAAIDAQGVDVAVALPAQPVSTYADDVRLTQAVSNLVHNAAKFSEWGGRVAVSLDQVQGQAIIRVRDWGRGIPPPDLERIFDPFVQSEVADTWRGGIGIGLALVRKLVELHGGHVGAFSEGSGSGAKFVVTLPLTEGPAQEVPPGAQPTSAPPTPTRVLVVDDNSEVRNAVQLLLQLHGHSVVTADCGRAALIEIERSGPDVVLLDIDLPDIDGYEVATRVRASRAGKAPRLVAITGSAGPREREKALRTGFDAHVAKPIDGPTLIRVVTGK